MTENLPQVYALDCYETALSFFRAGRFAKAQQKIREYKRSVDYLAFHSVDNRLDDPGRATVIIITRDRSIETLACIDSLNNQEDSAFETIVVDNGSDSSLQDILLNEKILLVECPVPFTPSEGRNIGAFHARTELLVFLDDDALAEPEFVKSSIQAFEQHPFLGIRGRILPKSSSADHSLAGVYDLGNYPLPALLDIEGNMAIPRKLYRAVEGMNPLLFGAEGLELTARLLQAHPEGDVYYWPGMVIRHDYASGDMLLAKRKRQALVNEYFRVMNGSALEIKKRYTEIYRMCRKEEQGALLKTVSAKIQTVCKDMSLAWKSEKTIPIHKALPAYEKNMLKPSGNRACQELSQKEAKALLKQVHVLEKEIETTRQSLTFRLGHLMREALSSPLRNGLLLPIRFGRLIREYKDRSGHADLNGAQETSINGKNVRNRVQYNRSGREEHAFTLFNEFQPYRKTRNSKLRIACILSPWMQVCLDLEADLIPLHLENWQETLKNSQPDFLLVQSLIEKSRLWQEHCAGMGGLPAGLAKLKRFCSRAGIPTVFWDTEDHVHFPLFSNIAPHFDHIFAADPKSATHYSELLSREVKHLGPAVQPALCNPFNQVNDNLTGFSILLDGWADLLEYPAEFEFLKPLLKAGLHIVDSRYRLMANKLDDLPAFRENIMGCISNGRRLSALRKYPILIMPDKSLSSPLARSWQALEAVACGCSVVMAGRQEGGELDGLVIDAGDNLSLRDKVLTLLKDEVTRLKVSHLARRKLNASHTYAHRLRTICESLEIDHGWEEFPLASVILPTKRPEMIKSCLEKFNSQGYPNKELIIVVNTDDVDMVAVQRMVDKFTDVSIFQMHQEKNIGVCLNFGVSQAKGKYWFKMDDDDYYGSNYLLDMVQSAGCADLHILGKPPCFIYLEDKGKVYLRDRATQSQHTIGANFVSHLCGATLGGNVDCFPGFSESHRACVDTGFVEGGKAMDLTLMTGDIWNFVAFRSSDKERHTWRHGDKGITESAVPFGKGLSFSEIMI